MRPLRNDARARDDEQFDLMPGHVIAERYRVRRTVRRGQTTVVFEAEHVLTGRIVAVKVCNPRAGSEAHRLIAESRTLGSMSHEGTPAVLDAGLLRPTQPFVVMERLVGRTVDGLLASRGRLGVLDSVQLAWRLALAAGEAHDHKIIHTDIKPANVMLVQSKLAEERGDRVCLIDFTSAEKDDPGRAHLLSARVSGATPEYRAPEQWLGHAATRATDVYAIGRVLYECLAGCGPFPEAAEEPLIAPAVTHEAPDVREHRPEIEARIASVVAKAVARDPLARFSSASALAQTLATIPGATEPLYALRGPTPPRSALARRRHRRAPYVAPIHLSWPGGSLDARTEDISVSGILVLARRAPAVGTMVEVKLTLPSGYTERLRAQVRWTREPAGMERLAAVGLEIIDIAHAAVSELRQYVSAIAGPSRRR